METNFGLDKETCDEIIKNYLNKKQESIKGKYHPENEKRFFMSSAGFDCMRLKYYQITNPRELPLEIMKTMYRGELYHSDIEKAFIKYYQQKFKNNISNLIFTEWDGKFKFEKQYGDIILSGKPDILISENQKLIPIELKSTNTDFCKKYLPYEEHITQVNLYLDWCESDEGYLIYCGYNFEFIPILVKKDKELINKTINKHKHLSYHIHNNIIPNKTESWKCKNCIYLHECEND